MIYDIIQELKATPGKNDKIAILKREANNELLKRVLVAALDPYTQYYMKKIPTHEAGRVGTLSLDAALASLPKLSRREITGNAAQEYVVKLLENVSEENADVLRRVILKNLDCGVQASTVNKAFPKLIATYPCLLAKGYDEKTIAKMEWPAYSQLKADGMRINAFIEDGNVTLRGRSGREVDLLGCLDAELLKLAKYVDMDEAFVIDGELLVEEANGSIMPRKKGNGILNKAIKGTISLDEASMVRMNVWDIIPLADFMREKCTTRYEERWNTIAAAVLEAQAKATVSKIDLIESIGVKDLKEAEAHFNEMLKRGEEGTLLKSPNHIWEDKRSYGLIKMKAEKDADLRVVGWVEGTGKYVGKLGALICRTDDGEVEVSVGGGFTDDERATLTEEKVIDRIITVLYNERIASKSTDREGVDSLFLPRFVELREDKNVTNSGKDIK